MKIGIFGDSYAARHKHGTGLAWFEMLKNNYNLDLECFGQQGSSLYYSYTKFIDQQDRFDKIVFLITGPGRLTLPLPQEYDQLNDSLRHTTNYDSFKFCVETNFKNDRYLNQVLKAVELYYLHLIDFQKDDLYHRLLTQEIQRVRPDALLIPCFDNLYLGSKYTLWDICKIDHDFYKLDSLKAPMADIRHCHLNQENNLILANKVYQWLETGEFTIDPDDYVTPSAPIEEYFNLDCLK